MMNLRIRKIVEARLHLMSFDNSQRNLNEDEQAKNFSG